MAKCQCPCGATFRVPDEAIGKKAKCRKCGAVFTLADQSTGPIPIADDPWPDEGELARAAAARPEPATPRTSGSDPLGGLDNGAAGSDAAEARGYAGNVLWTFLFPTSLGNLFTFLMIWVCLSVGLFLPGLVCPLMALALFIFVTGWYSAYRFSIIQSAAAGENDLPDAGLSTDMMADIAEGLVAWIGSWLVVMVPALVYLTATWQPGTASTVEALQRILGGLTGIWQGKGTLDHGFYALVCMGVALWPMVVLCVALGGFSALARIDLIILTIIKTFPAYALTLLLLFGATALQIVLVEVASKQTAAAIAGGAGSAWTIGIALSFAVRGVQLYTDIVCMRLVGLYYHHFKHRFAWSWG